MNSEISEQEFRDYFAARALQGILANSGNGQYPSRHVEVQMAWNYADLMMDERAKRIKERKS